jgi:MoxR-like ATPase
LPALRQALNLVTVRAEITGYLLDVVRRTRTDDNILSGAGPRAAQSLLMASRGNAALSGRDFVTPDDVRVMAQPVLGHRILLRPEAEIEGVTPGEALAGIIRDIPVPR